MNMHVCPRTETELKAHRRHEAFVAAIAEKAAALRDRREGARAPGAAPPVSPQVEPWSNLPPPHIPEKIRLPVALVFSETPRIIEIQHAVATACGMSVAEMLKERRFAPIVRARQIAMFICKEMTFKSLPEIGRKFGGKDHTTVLHAARKLPVKMASDPDLRALVSEVRRQLQAAIDARRAVDTGSDSAAAVSL